MQILLIYFISLIVFTLTNLHMFIFLSDRGIFHGSQENVFELCQFTGISMNCLNESCSVYLFQSYKYKNKLPVNFQLDSSNLSIKNNTINTTKHCVVLV